MDTLLNFSGGIDSTYCLWDYLTNHPDKPLLIHHCQLKNHERRNELEFIAVQSILAWVQKRGMDNFKYIQTGFDFGNMGFLVPDKEVIGFFTGCILAKKSVRIERVIISSSKDDMAKRKYYTHSEAKRLAIIHTVGRREPEYIYPIMEMTRAEMMAKMPKDLLALTWYCRTPKNNKPCEKCPTCRAVQNGLKSIEKEP
jgi:7-cyano-7-deazaguanine synthase in queuosine biosynthesis